MELRRPLHVAIRMAEMEYRFVNHHFIERMPQSEFIPIILGVPEWRQRGAVCGMTVVHSAASP
jgi:hypothetical protein